MNLMFSYSRVAAGRRLSYPPMAHSVRRTSEKLVGSHLPRPLTSPSCGAPRYPAPALTGVRCERVSGTRMETLVDDLGELLLITMESKTKQKIVYGAGEGYPSAGVAAGCKAGPVASSSSNTWPRRPSGGGQQGPRWRSCVWRGRHGNREDSERAGGTRRYEHRPGNFVGRDAAGGGSDDEMPLCSPSPAVTGALGKRSCRRIAGPAEGTASAANGRSGGTGHCMRRGTRPRRIRTSCCCRLLIKGRREARGAGRAPTPIPTPRLLLWPPPLPPLLSAAVPPTATLREATG